MNLPPFLPEAAHSTITLPANCNTQAAEELQVRLVLTADARGPIRIDAAQVQALGQASLQLLLAARAAAADSGAAFEISDPSPTFVEWVSRCGLEEALGLPVRAEIAA